MQIREAVKESYTISAQTLVKDTATATQIIKFSEQLTQKLQGTATTPDADDVTISDEARIKATGKKSFEEALEQMRAEKRELQRQMEQARKMGEGVAEMYKDKLKCLQIAMRIMQGDKVPPADLRFLSEKEPELYTKALSMRVEKEDPKEHDRLSEDEEDEAEATDDGEPSPVRSDGGESAAEPAPEAGGEPGSGIDVEA